MIHKTWTVIVALWVTQTLQAREPEVIFQVADKQLIVAVSQDEQPIADVTVRLLGPTAQDSASGSTDACGQCVLPMPTETVFVLEIQIGSRLADPITLTKVNSDQLVVPKEVLLTFGLAPCCRISDRYATKEEVPDTTTGPIPPWAKALIAIMSLFGSVFFLGRAWQHRKRLSSQ